MTPDRSRAVQPLLALGLVALFLFLAVAGVKGWRDLMAARAQEETLALKIGQAEERIVALRGRIDRLVEDPALVERLAREDLGMVRPGEVVIRLPAEGPDPHHSR